MDPLFLGLLAVLAAVFVYAARRSMRQTPLPTPQDAAADLKQAAAARQASQVDSVPRQPVQKHDHPADAMQPPAAGEDRGVQAESTTSAREKAGRRAAPRQATRPERSRPKVTRERLGRGPLLESTSTASRSSRAFRMFGNRQGLHHAVIAMTVLGPCRALDPYPVDGYLR